MNQFVKTIEPSKISYEFLKSLNGLMSLTERELRLLAMFLDFHLDKVRDRKYKSAIDSSENRKYLINNFNVTKDNLSRYIKMYKAKGIFQINPEDNLLTMNKALIPKIIGGKTVQIVMILKLKEND